MKRAATIVLALVALAAPARAAAAGSPCAGAQPSGDAQLKLVSGGVTRTAVLHVPPGATQGRRLPLVIALHGAGSNGRAMEAYSGLDVVADGAHFAVVYPDAVAPHPFWNYTGNRAKPDDVAFTSDLIDAVEARVCTDRLRVYATGISNGASMAARLGCALSARIAAIAPVSGSYSHQPACTPSRPVSVLEIHGTADRSVPYGGVVLGYLNGWVARDHCTGAAHHTTLAPGTLRFDWPGCAGGTQVAHIRIGGGPHQWPGGLPSAPSTISADWEVWRFLRRLRLG